jgi:hypothetical protein
MKYTGPKSKDSCTAAPINSGTLSLVYSSQALSLLALELSSALRLSGSWIIGFVFFSLSALFFAFYRWTLRMLSNRGTDSGWLNTPDQLICVELIGLAIFLSDSNIIVLFFSFFAQVHTVIGA